MCHIHATILQTEDWLGLASTPQTSLPLPEWPGLWTVPPDTLVSNSLVPSSKGSLVL